MGRGYKVVSLKLRTLFSTVVTCQVFRLSALLPPGGCSTTKKITISTCSDLLYMFHFSPCKVSTAIPVLSGTVDSGKYRRPNGIGNLSTKVPDSTTTWIASAFSVNAKTGIAVTAQNKEITVWKKFFVTVDLPRYIVEGEQFLFQITAFNYMSTRQQVYIQIEHSDDVANPIADGFSVPAGKSESIFKPFTPGHVGEINVTVNARAMVGFFTATSVDIVKKTIIVKPAGLKQVRNVQTLVDVKSGTNFQHSVTIPTPRHMVHGTKRIEVRITGDFMTPSVDGLESLLAMPYGCGEQNMLRFAPAIYITNYLKTSGKLTASIRQKAERIMNDGKQREFRYQRNDGSFSAFGNTDSSGSSWLTAFVLKCFHEAKDITNVDINKRTEALIWLLRHQASDGSFTEPGRIIHKAMQSGTSAGIKRSAFITISLLENKDHPGLQSTIKSKTTKAKQYLESHLSGVHDGYTMAILCYAVKLAESGRSVDCFRKIQNTGIHQGSQLHWTAKTNASKQSVPSQRATPLHDRAPSMDIETTAYTLLLYCKMGAVSEAFPIVQWLISQRNPTGGFSSTQDTVLSLQALSEYASLVSKHAASPPNLHVSIETPASMHFDINNSNKDLLQTAKIPDSANTVTIKADGQGTLLVDTVVSYYIESSTSTNFSLTTQITHESLDSITVQACARYLHSNSTGMAIMEVGIPTGFVADGEMLKKQSNVPLFELNTGKAVLYFNSISNSSQCVNVKSDRSDPVVKSQACTVVVYDYYEPSYQAMTTYDSGILKNSNICDVCSQCQWCAPTIVG